MISLIPSPNKWPHLRQTHRCIPELVHASKQMGQFF
jgi:hypothetical protein